jgi:serine/threonine-protein kinase
MMGSPLYMAPEQMRSTKNADGRSDIWSLGVILYEFLAGETPFRADSLGELFARVMMEPHPPLAQRRPDLPAGLGEVVDRCLQKDPTHRFQSVEQLAVSLGPFASARSAVLVARLRDTLTGVAGGPTNPPPAPAAAQQDLAATDIETVNILPIAAEAAVNAETNTTWEGSRAADPQKKKSHRALAAGAATALAMSALGLALWLTRQPAAPTAEPQAAASPPQPAPAVANPTKTADEAPAQKPPAPTAQPVTASGGDDATENEGEAETEAKAQTETKARTETKAQPKPETTRRPSAPTRVTRSTSKPKASKSTRNNPLSIEFK